LEEAFVCVGDNAAGGVNFHVKLGYFVDSSRWMGLEIGEGRGFFCKVFL
jgi:hypothetical protein